MSWDADEIYELLPAVYRVRDAEQGEPLRQLIEVIASQVAVVEESLEQLYDNHFVETAQSWALPYIGDLLGIRGLSGGGTLTRAPRAEVGHTIAYRRRKGTAAMLELLAHDVTGWPAHAVEFFERLALTQYVNHVRLQNRAFVSLHVADELEFFATPFETATRTVEVRRIEPKRGKWNIPNVGLFLWRLSAYSLTRTPLAPVQVPPVLADKRHFRFCPLGLDLPLFSLPITEVDFSHLAEPLNVPMPISRRMLKGDEYAGSPNQFHPSADYYGSGRSIRLEKLIGGTFEDIVWTDLIVADLSDTKDSGGNAVWAHEPFGQSENKVLLDPTLGRVLFPTPVADDEPVLATFYYGFSRDMGGGEYDRSRSFDTSASTIVEMANTDSSKVASVDAAYQALGASGGIVEILDSSVYPETLATIEASGGDIELRASDGRRPTVIFQNPLTISGDANGVVTLNGLLVGGKGIHVTGDLGTLRLRHCTIIALGADGSVKLDGTPVITIESATTVVEIEDSIVGPIRVGPDIAVQLKNCIVDAGDAANVAMADLKGSGPAGSWKIENCTIRGKVSVSVLELASNTIFLSDLATGDDPIDWPAPLFVQRRQEGCVRFCWVPPNARAPRRYQCLPTEGGPLVRPTFTSFRFGDAAYGQLGRFCPEAVRCGADDESEIGAFHNLLQPQREAQLEARLLEYLRFGLEAGIFYAT
jgi:hypothetical protein